MPSLLIHILLKNCHAQTPSFCIKAFNLLIMPFSKSNFHCKVSNSTRAIGNEVLNTFPKLF